MSRNQASLQFDNFPQDTVPCEICNRYFVKDRIAKHQKVCKNSMKERNTFDAGQHRVQGTEAEKYYKPLDLKNSAFASTSTQRRVTSNWRIAHEEFITAIRAARAVQAHLAKGGKLSELPPSTPSENLDYVKCPHCLRKFNETAANRHIPKCANMIHNKPKHK